MLGCACTAEKGVLLDSAPVQCGRKGITLAGSWPSCPMERSSVAGRNLVEYLTSLGPLPTGSKPFAQGGCSPFASQAVLVMIGRIMSLGMPFYLVQSQENLLTDANKNNSSTGGKGCCLGRYFHPLLTCTSSRGTEKPKDWLKATYWLGVELKLDTGGLTSEPKFLTAAYYSSLCFHAPYEQESRLFGRLLSVADTLTLLLWLC